MFKDYGLMGQTIKVRKRTLGETKGDPWAYAEQDMRIEAEYPRFLVATVLPGVHPHGFGGLSKPYRTCLSKFDIQSGEILLNGGTIR